MTDRDERRRKASELIGGGPLTPEEIESDYVLRDIPKPPREGHSAPRSGTTAPALDIPAIRYGVREGRIGDDDYWRSVVLALCERVEEAETHLERSIGRHFALDDLLLAARAWADAITQGNLNEIDRLEGELLEAVSKCMP